MQSCCCKDKDGKCVCMYRHYTKRNPQKPKEDIQQTTGFSHHQPSKSLGLHVRLLIMTVIDTTETDRRQKWPETHRQDDRQPERKSARESLNE